MNTRSTGNGIAILALALAWGQMLWFLHYNWSSESSYNYGWAVPPLVLLLLLPRLKHDLGKCEQDTPTLFWSLAIMGLLAFGLARLLIEVNPFWRLPLWMGATSLVVSSWALIRLSYGKHPARRAVFPLLFSLTMVPWPSMVQKLTVNTLTELVNRVSIESLQILGHPAEQLGDIIRIGNVTVGVEEACSGIKSLQALSMIALFVGAYWGLRVSGRAFLLIAAILLTLVFNLARSLTLSLLVVSGGQGLFDEWHDTVGHIALGLGLLGLFAIGAKLPMASPPTTNETKLPPSGTVSISLALASVTLILAAIPFFVSELWYKDEANNEAAERTDWTIDIKGLASPNIETRSLPIHQRIENILGFDYGYHLAISQKGGPYTGDLWYYGFTGESKSKSLMAYGHSPTICMEASGALMQDKLEPLRVDLGALEIPFQHYSFRLPDGRISQVFWCLWDDLHKGDTESVDGQSRVVQFKSFLKRKRSLKRKIALLGIPEEDPEQGRLIATKLVRDLFLLKQGGKTFRYK